jgi:hypothetical protein
VSVLLGNLDVECRWATPPFHLPEAVLERISLAATLLRVFASDGDRLWTPRPVDPDSVPEAEGLARPRLISGPPPDEVDWEWGQRTTLAARLNDKAWVCDLKDCEVIESVGRFEGKWVVKDPFGAAGRGHLRGEGPPDERQRRSIERRLARFGSLIRERWIEREADFGCVARVEDGEARVIGVHRLLVDDAGRFAGIRKVDIDLAPGEEVALRGMAAVIGERLLAEGYTGPFGIDACRSVNGEFHPLLEANVRCTFGHVAWALDADALEFGETTSPGATPLLRADGFEAWIR